MTSVANIVSVDTAGAGELSLFAEQAFHLFRLGKVFDGCAADEAAGGGGHEGGLAAYSIYLSFIILIFGVSVPII